MTAYAAEHPTPALQVQNESNIETPPPGVNDRPLQASHEVEDRILVANLEISTLAARNADASDVPVEETHNTNAQASAEFTNATGGVHMQPGAVLVNGNGSEVADMVVSGSFPERVDSVEIVAEEEVVQVLSSGEAHLQIVQHLPPAEDYGSPVSDPPEIAAQEVVYSDTEDDDEIVAQTTDPKTKPRRKASQKPVGSDQKRQAFSKRKKGIVLKAYQLYKLTDSKVFLFIANDKGSSWAYATPGFSRVLNHQSLRAFREAALSSPTQPPLSPAVITKDVVPHPHLDEVDAVLEARNAVKTTNLPKQNEQATWPQLAPGLMAPRGRGYSPSTLMQVKRTDMGQPMQGDPMYMHGAPGGGNRPVGGLPHPHPAPGSMMGPSPGGPVPFSPMGVQLMPVPHSQSLQMSRGIPGSSGGGPGEMHMSQMNRSMPPSMGGPGKMHMSQMNRSMPPNMVGGSGEVHMRQMSRSMPLSMAGGPNEMHISQMSRGMPSSMVGGAGEMHMSQMHTSPQMLTNGSPNFQTMGPGGPGSTPQRPPPSNLSQDAASTLKRILEQPGVGQALANQPKQAKMMIPKQEDCGQEGSIQRLLQQQQASLHKSPQHGQQGLLGQQPQQQFRVSDSGLRLSDSGQAQGLAGQSGNNQIISKLQQLAAGLKSSPQASQPQQQQQQPLPQQLAAQQLRQILSLSSERSKSESGGEGTVIVKHLPPQPQQQAQIGPQGQLPQGQYPNQYQPVHRTSQGAPGGQPTQISAAQLRQLLGASGGQVMEVVGGSDGSQRMVMSNQSMQGSSQAQQQQLQPRYVQMPKGGGGGMVPMHLQLAKPAQDSPSPRNTNSSPIIAEGSMNGMAGAHQGGNVEDQQRRNSTGHLAMYPRNNGNLAGNLQGSEQQPSSIITQNGRNAVEGATVCRADKGTWGSHNVKGKQNIKETTSENRHTGPHAGKRRGRRGVEYHQEEPAGGNRRRQQWDDKGAVVEGGTRRGIHRCLQSAVVPVAGTHGIAASQQRGTQGMTSLLSSNTQAMVEPTVADAARWSGVDEVRQTLVQLSRWVAGLRCPGSTTLFQLHASRGPPLPAGPSPNTRNPSSPNTTSPWPQRISP
eukprot:gene6195-2814_t